MGSRYYPLEFTNVSGRTCQLHGFPGVSAYGGGQRIGRSASWDPTVPARVVTLTPHATAHALLRIVNVGAYPVDRCRPVSASHLQVYPPNQSTAAVYPFTVRACSVTATNFLDVRAVQPGIGTP